MPSHRSNEQLSADSGLTLFEIMIALAIVGLLLFLGFYALGAVTRTNLRHDAVKITAALRSTKSLAAQSGMHHRLVIDLDKQTYRIEMCPDAIHLVRGTDEEQKVDKQALERLKQQPNPLAAGPSGLAGGLSQLSAAMGPSALSQADAALAPGAQAATADDALKASAALAGVRIGSARCGLAPASPGDTMTADNPQTPTVHALDRNKGISIRRVYVQHLREAVTKGEVSINFFPLGRAEKALIEVVDKDGDQFTVLVYGLSGRIELRDGPVDPDKHMRRDATGQEIRAHE